MERRSMASAFAAHLRVPFPDFVVSLQRRSAPFAATCVAAAQFEKALDAAMGKTACEALDHTAR